MLVGKVVGNVVSTKKNEALVGYKLLIVNIMRGDDCFENSIRVAADVIGAGNGELVLLTQGSSARYSLESGGIPVDLSVVGIIDTMDMI